MWGDTCIFLHWRVDCLNKYKPCTRGGTWCSPYSLQSDTLPWAWGLGAFHKCMYGHWALRRKGIFYCECILLQALGLIMSFYCIFKGTLFIVWVWIRLPRRRGRNASTVLLLRRSSLSSFSYLFKQLRGGGWRNKLEQLNIMPDVRCGEEFLCCTLKTRKLLFRMRQSFPFPFKSQCIM